MTDGTGLDPATREIQELLHDFGQRWKICQREYAGVLVWEAEPRKPPVGNVPASGMLIRKNTVPELVAALEIMNGRLL
jgi:hypothetical protein